MNFKNLGDFWNFSAFYEFKSIYFELKWIKMTFFYRLLTWQLMWRVLKCIVMWQCRYMYCGARICMCGSVCAGVCGRVCAQVCACLIKNPYSGYKLSHKSRIHFIRVKLLWLLSCGTIFLCFNAQVMWRHVERSIAQFHRDCWSSLKWRGTWCTLIRQWIFLKWFNLSRSSKEL